MVLEWLLWARARPVRCSGLWGTGYFEYLQHFQVHGFRSDLFPAGCAFYSRSTRELALPGQGHAPLRCKSARSCNLPCTTLLGRPFCSLLLVSACMCIWPRPR